MDNLATLHEYNRPGSSVRESRGSFEFAPGTMRDMFEGGPVRGTLEGPRPVAKSKLEAPATSRDLIALAPCVNLRPEDILILVVLDGRVKVSETLYGEPGSGCPLAPADKLRMEAALAAMPVKAGDRLASSGVRDLHLFEGQ